MSDNEPNEAGAGPDELTMLKQRAATLGIKFSNNIGLDALRAKVNDTIKVAPKDPMDEPEPDEESNEAEEAEEAPAALAVREPDAPVSDEERAELVALRAAMAKLAAQSEAETINDLNPLAGDKVGKTPSAKMTVRQRVMHEAMALIRCRITNLDPKKKDLHGEILCVGNRYIGTIRKFIPYGEMTEDGFHVPKVLFDELDSRKFLHIQTKRNKQNGQIEVKTSYAKEFSLEVMPQLTADELAKLASAQMSASSDS